MTSLPGSKRMWAKSIRAGAKVLEDGCWTKGEYVTGPSTIMAYCAVGAIFKAKDEMGSISDWAQPLVGLTTFNDDAPDKETVIKKMRQLARHLEHGGNGMLQNGELI